MSIRDKVLYLTSRGVSITEIAKRAECSHTTIAKWLRGESKLSARLERDVDRLIIEYIKELNVILED